MALELRDIKELAKQMKPEIRDHIFEVIGTPGFDFNKPHCQEDIFRLFAGINDFHILQAACRSGNPAAISLILDHPSFDKDLINAWDGEALKCACMSGNPKAISLILDHPNFNKGLINSCYGQVLKNACMSGNVAAISLILRHANFDKSLINAWDGEVLGEACRSGNPKAISLILNHRTFNKDLINANNGQVLEAACKSGNPAAISLILNHRTFNKDLINARYGGALRGACRSGNPKAISLILNHPNFDKRLINALDGEALREACYSGNPVAISLILDHPNFDKRLINASGGQALREACRSGNPAAISLILDHPNFDTRLINALNGEALREACYSGNPTAISLILSHRNFNKYFIASCNGEALTAAYLSGNPAAISLILNQPELIIPVGFHVDDLISPLLHCACESKHFVTLARALQMSDLHQFTITSDDITLGELFMRVKDELPINSAQDFQNAYDEIKGIREGYLPLILALFKFMDNGPEFMASCIRLIDQLPPERPHNWRLLDFHKRAYLARRFDALMTSIKDKAVDTVGKKERRLIELAEILDMANKERMESEFERYASFLNVVVRDMEGQRSALLGMLNAQIQLGESIESGRLEKEDILKAVDLIRGYALSLQAPQIAARPVPPGPAALAQGAPPQTHQSMTKPSAALPRG